jgi:hypothetical protein
VRNGRNTRKMIQTALSHPLREWSRKMSPMIVNTTIRYEMKTKDQKNQPMRSQMFMSASFARDTGVPEPKLVSGEPVGVTPLG